MDAVGDGGDTWWTSVCWLSDNSVMGESRAGGKYLVEIGFVQRVAAAKHGKAGAFQGLSSHPEVCRALVQPLTEPPAHAGCCLLRHKPH